MSPSVVVHGHFYQPPRHDPWTEAMPVEPSAAPAHDWNERIDAECYRPNGAARLVDGQGRIVDIVNNFALVSFNVGPTLDTWLSRHAPLTLERMVAGDRIGGGAIAQPFHHVILPLANERDVRTEIRWGQSAFRHRFGREPEGLWLPETAVNDDVLAICVEEGVRYTILSPYQAAETPAPGTVYRWSHPDGRGDIALVFYDGPLSHDVAFGAALRSGDTLVQRAAAAASDGVVVVATDGETFGHHHKFTERAIAYAFTVAAPAHGVATGALAGWLREHPPTATMTVHESAWSCAHGVGRWKEDCGCSTGGLPDANQRWRAPLRQALDLLRDHAARVFETRGAAVLVDPWAARDDYVRVVLDPTQRPDFCDRHLLPGADPVVALTLLESQREAMAMYTSCGWFFWDLAGIETLQVLRHAAHCMDRLAELGTEPPVAEFLRVLDTASSNDTAQGTGGQVWKRHVAAFAGSAAQVASAALACAADGRHLRDIAPAWDVMELPTFLEAGAVLVADGPLAVTDVRTGAVHRWHVSAVAVDGAVADGRLRPTGAEAWRPVAGWGAVTALDDLDGAPLDLRPVAGEHFDAVRRRWDALVAAAAHSDEALVALAPALGQLAAQDGWGLPVPLALERAQEVVHAALARRVHHPAVDRLADRLDLVTPARPAAPTPLVRPPGAR